MISLNFDILVTYFLYFWIKKIQNDNTNVIIVHTTEKAVYLNLLYFKNTKDNDLGNILTVNLNIKTYNILEISSF